jgi:hypothetical protein
LTLNLHALVLFGLLAGGIHWLVARSSIAKPLWSRATGMLDELLRCAGCSGWWIGLVLWLVHVRPIDGGFGAHLLTGVLGAALTPVVEAVLLWGLEATAIDRSTPVANPAGSFDAHDAYDDIMDKLCDERSDLSPDEIERVGGTVQRALGLVSEAGKP